MIKTIKYLSQIPRSKTKSPLGGDLEGHKPKVSPWGRFRGAFLLLFLLVSYPSFAQQANVWAFGWHGGLNFNFDPPKTFFSGMDRYAGGDSTFGIALYSSSICDCSGKLLFYTNGQITWNRNNQYMPHGFRNACGNHAIVDNSYQSTSFILKKPGDSFTYYVFYGASLGKGSSTPCLGLFCYTIDMQ